MPSDEPARATCHDHNLRQPLPELRPFGIRVRLRRGDPFRKLLGDEWTKEHWFATRDERDARLQEMSETQANALGELPGTGGGYSLMFNGHMDISYTEKEVYVPGGENTMVQQSAGTTGFSLEPSIIDDGWIKGNGIRNMKSAMAAYHNQKKV